MNFSFWLLCSTSWNLFSTLKIFSISVEVLSLFMHYFLDLGRHLYDSYFNSLLLVSIDLLISVSGDLSFSSVWNLFIHFFTFLDLYVGFCALYKAVTSPGLHRLASLYLSWEKLEVRVLFLIVQYCVSSRNSGNKVSLFSLLASVSLFSCLPQLLKPFN